MMNDAGRGTGRLLPGPIGARGREESMDVREIQKQKQIGCASQAPIWGDPVEGGANNTVGTKPRALTPIHLSSTRVPLLWQVALTRETDFPKVYSGNFLVHMVVDHTGEAGIGLAQGQVHMQAPGAGGWSWCPTPLQLPGKTLALPGHLQILSVPWVLALQSDIAPVWCDGW